MARIERFEKFGLELNLQQPAVCPFAMRYGVLSH